MARTVRATAMSAAPSASSVRLPILSITTIATTVDAMYLGDYGHTSFAQSETAITPANRRPRFATAKYSLFIL